MLINFELLASNATAVMRALERFLPLQQSQSWGDAVVPVAAKPAPRVPTMLDCTTVMMLQVTPTPTLTRTLTLTLTLTHRYDAAGANMPLSPFVSCFSHVSPDPPTPHTLIPPPEILQAGQWLHQLPDRLHRARLGHASPR